MSPINLTLPCKGHLLYQSGNSDIIRFYGGWGGGGYQISSLLGQGVSADLTWLFDLSFLHKTCSLIAVREKSKTSCSRQYLSCESNQPDTALQRTPALSVWEQWHYQVLWGVGGGGYQISSLLGQGVSADLTWLFDLSFLHKTCSLIAVREKSKTSCSRQYLSCESNQPDTALQRTPALSVWEQWHYQVLWLGIDLTRSLTPYAPCNNQVIKSG